MSPTPETGVPVCYRHPGRESHIRCQRCNRPICPDCMRDAAVGFQCPSCVAEGRKATRSGRTAYGGLRPTNASTTTFALIGINVAVWLAVLGTGQGSSRLVQLLALTPRGVCSTSDGGYYPSVDSALQCSTLPNTTWGGVAGGDYWQLVTSMFMHVAPLHIGLNMFTLYILGPQLEIAIGRARFLALYLISGLAGSASVMWIGSPSGSTLGASGAIYGLLGGLLLLSFKVGGDVRSILSLIGVNVVFSFVVPGISWQAHLGGLAGGIAAAAIIAYAPRGPRRTPFQVAGLIGLTAVVALVIIARIAVLA